MNSKTASLALFFVFCLAGVSKSTPLAYETISLEPGIQSRAAWCQNVFGVQACLDASFNGTKLRVMFKLDDSIVFDRTYDPLGYILSAPEYCFSKLGVEMCLKVAFSLKNACFTLKGTAPLLGSKTFDLGCITFFN